MHEPDLFLIFVEPLNQAAIPYMVTGSVACIAYGQPRLTHGVDVVIELARPHPKRVRMGVFSVRCSVFRRGSGLEELLSLVSRGQRSPIGLLLARP